MEGGDVPPIHTHLFMWGEQLCFTSYTMWHWLEGEWDSALRWTSCWQSDMGVLLPYVRRKAETLELTTAQSSCKEKGSQRPGWVGTVLLLDVGWQGLVGQLNLQGTWTRRKAASWLFTSSRAKIPLHCCTCIMLFMLSSADQVSQLAAHSHFSYMYFPLTHPNLITTATLTLPYTILVHPSCHSI